MDLMLTRLSLTQLANNLDESEAEDWCPWRDLNPHSFRKRILSPPRLPFHHKGIAAPLSNAGRLAPSTGKALKAVS